MNKFKNNIYRVALLHILVWVVLFSLPYLLSSGQSFKLGMLVQHSWLPLVLYAVLVSAAYTFAVAVAASRDRLRWLRSARLGAYATSAFVGLAVAMLAYAFVTHDFRIRYVAHYSDRSMSLGYLLAALWGGQDGSLLWWASLLSIFVAICVRWMHGRYRVLQPIVIATLMVVEGFFVILMLFAANPFQVSLAGAPAEGEGLNPLLQNYWMVIHPPSLYTGFVAATIPFAFGIGALASGRLDDMWLGTVRSWMLICFGFLSLGDVQQSAMNSRFALKSCTRAINLHLNFRPVFFLRSECIVKGFFLPAHSFLNIFFHCGK